MCAIVKEPGSESSVDVLANRAAIKWSRRQLLGRALWETLGSAAFSLSPRPMWGFRNWLLKIFGAKLGRDVRFHPTVKIAIPWNLTLGPYAAVGDRVILYSLGTISIGDRTTVSQGAHLCAGSHDYRHHSMPLLKPPIAIGHDVWICADAFVGPGVMIGPRAIVGARAVVTKDVPADAIFAGNPAREIGKRSFGSGLKDIP